MDILLDLLTAAFRLITFLIFGAYGWILIVAVVSYLLWQNRRRTKWVMESENVTLILEIPRTNDKKELAAEQMFASLHGILRPKGELRREGAVQEHISFEMAVINQQIRFYIWVPKHLQSFVEGQVYAQYPEVQIREAEEDYASRDITQSVVHTAELALNKNDMLPIKTFPSFEVDPLAAITGTLAKLEDSSEELWIQILARPVDDSWHRQGERFINHIKHGGKDTLLGAGAFRYGAQAISALNAPPSESGNSGPDLTERQRAQIKAVEEKTIKLGYEMKIRLAYLGNDRQLAKLRMQAMVGTFKQFNSTNLNGFTTTHSSFDHKALKKYKARYFHAHGNLVNIEELASVWHLPHTNVETPGVVWASSKTAEPPSNLPAVNLVPPEELSPFGTTNFRGIHTQFGIKRSDRGRHLYVVGQTGTGKSGLLELLTLSDIFHGQGFAVIDPHGDYAQSVLKFIPPNRIEDVIYFNPSDTEFPIAFNPLEVTDPALKNHISSELVGVLKRMFDSWGPRLEYILRYTILALLDTPDSTMLGITRMLTEKGFRQEIIANITDPVVRNFWVTEFASWNDKFAAEAVAPVLNKVGAFTANPMIRNIIGQPKSSMNLRQAMDEGKILVVNLSRGLVGEDNAAILGALMVTKLQLAAMSRANIEQLAQRRPFYLYVDEFQNFATDSFAVILSEARKYGLNLTVANQYVSQMTPIVKDAVFGNVGSLISFRVGAEDGAVMQKYFEPQFSSQDLINLNNRHFVASLAIDGEKAAPFSATTLNLPAPQQDFTLNIIENSRARYAKPRAEIEHSVNQWTMPAPEPAKPQQQVQPQTLPAKPKHSKPKFFKQSKAPAPVSQPQTNTVAPKTHGALDEDEEIHLH